MAWIREPSSAGQYCGVRLVAAQGHFGVVMASHRSWSSSRRASVSVALTDGTRR